MNDITMYGERELSLNYLNDYELYKEMQRCVRLGRTFDEFKERTVDELFTYTPEQLSDLEDTYYEEGEREQEPVRKSKGYEPTEDEIEEGFVNRELGLESD